jgi:GNAT superfamily N-acetyltransferase
MTQIADWTVETPGMGDAAALSAMAQQSFCEAFAQMNYPPDDLAQFLDEAMGAARFATHIADPDFALRVVREKDGRIIGFIKLGPNELPLPPDEDMGDPPLELHQLYLREEAKGTGIADALMAWLLDEAHARSAAALTLSVFIENHRAQAFYARHGFVEIGKNPFRIGSVVDDDRVWKLTL